MILLFYEIDFHFFDLYSLFMTLKRISGYQQKKVSLFLMRLKPALHNVKFVSHQLKKNQEPMKKLQIIAPNSNEMISIGTIMIGLFHN